MLRLKQYLQKIRRGQPINYEAFLRRLPEAVRRKHRDIFRPEKVSGNGWVVHVLDPSAFAELEQSSASPVSRAHAAEQGDSHRHGTGHSFLLVYREGLASDRPDTVVVSESGADCGFGLQPSAMVIENEENFFEYQRMLAFASACENTSLGLENCDVVLGSGNRITRRACMAWLNRYQRVYCAFDYDAGGLQMFATMAGYLGEKASFIQPRNLESWHPKFRKAPANTERFTRGIQLAEGLGFSSLATAFRETGKFMEQEMILDD
ncbi:MAG: hypothetical protein SV598_07110 [Pseudomonadota bacterium]|nr:hypothetical protein [Pseudomonadota bacterium]